MTTTDKTPMLKAAVAAVSQAIRQALDGPVDDDQTAPDDASWRRQLARLEDIPAGQLRDLAADVAMEAYLLGIEKEASRHTNAGKVVSPTGRPPRVDGEDIVIRDLRRQLVAARQETARVRSQLAEARDALARVARTLGWDAPPEQVPSGIPDLAIAVQQLRHERDQARAVLAEARQERDHAQRWNDEARRAWAVDSAELAVVRGELAAAREAYQRLAEAAQTVADALDAEVYPDAIGVVSAARISLKCADLRDVLRRALAATAPETAPTAPQTDEQTQVRGEESHTEPAGTVHDALHRIADHLDIPPWISPAETAWRVIDEIDRLRELANQASELGITDTDQPASARVDLVIGLRQRGVPQHPDGPEAAALAEIDRLRTILRENGDHRG